MCGMKWLASQYLIATSCLQFFFSRCYKWTHVPRVCKDRRQETPKARFTDDGHTVDVRTDSQAGRSAVVSHPRVPRLPGRPLGGDHWARRGDAPSVVAGVDADASTRSRVRPPDALEIPSRVARPLPPR